MPKNLCTLMMLAATDTKGRLHRMIPADMSYPEKQSYENYKKGELVPTEVRTIVSTLNEFVLEIRINL